MGYTYPLAMLALACACWGLSFPLARAVALAQHAAVPEVSTWCLSAWGLVLRFAIAAVVLGWWNRREFGRPTTAEWSQAFGFGLFTAGGMLLQLDALSHTDASTVAFLTQGSAVWIPLFAALRARRLPDPWTLLCIATVMVGVGILAGVDLRTLRLGRGETEAVLCSLVFSAQIIGVERPAYAANRPGLVLSLAFTIAALAILPLVAVTAPSAGALLRLYADPWRIVLLVVLAVFSTGMGMLLMIRHQRHIGATAAAIVYCTEPIWAALFAFVLPSLLGALLAIPYADEHLTVGLAIGGTLVLAANVGLHWRPRLR